MSHTLANGGSGTVQVNVRPLIKTCPEEAGIGELHLEDGTQILVLGNFFWPSQDRNAVALAHQLLQHKRARVEAGEIKDIVVVLMGNVINGEAFKGVTATKDRTNKLLGKRVIPELAKVKAEYESPEEKWNALAQMAGEFIAEFAKSSGGHVYYVPAVGLRSEVQLFDYVLEQKERLDATAERHPEEAVVGPEIPEDFAEFLGLHENANITVMPFGAALRINGIRFQCGDYKRRQPGTAALTDVEHNLENVVRTGDGKVASAWWTTPVHSLGDSHRRWWQAHEVGHMYDITQGLGFQRNYDRRGRGLWLGTVVSGTIFGTAFPILRGTDGRRSIVIDGVPFNEDQPGGHFNVFSLQHPVRAKAARPVQTATKTLNKRAPRTTSTRSTKRTK